MEESEFGKGLVICLVKFAEHFMVLGKRIEEYAKMRERRPELFRESSAIELWANGATDHLYEIEAPKGVEWDEIREKVKTLKEKGLEMGHGFTNQEWKLKDAENLMDLTREIAILIDKKLSLEPEIGSW